MVTTPWILTIIIGLSYGCSNGKFSAGDFSKAGKKGKNVPSAGGNADTADGSKNNGGNDGAGDAQSSPSNPVGGDGSTSPTPVPGAGAGSPTDRIFDGDGAVPAPTDCQAQKLLIVDFKSGWWDDLGKGMLDHVRDGLEKACPSQPSTLEYYHSWDGDKHKQYYADASFSYTQVWIFSGAEGIEEDLPLDDPKLADLISRIKEKKPKLLLTGGIGSVDHSNKIATETLGTAVFEKVNKYIEPKFDAAKTTTISHATHLMPAGIFSGISGPLPDHLNIDKDGKLCASDNVLIPPGMHLAAECKGDKGQKVNCIALGQVNGYRVIVDSGWQRTYATVTTSDGEKVKQYLRNLVRLLAN